MAVAAQAQRAARAGQRPGRADPVGQVGLGGRAETGHGPAAAEQPDVAGGEVRGVHHRAARAQGARLVQQSGRGDAVRGQARLVLGGLLGQVRVQRRAERMRPGDHRMHLARRHRPHRVDRHPGAGVRAEHAVLVRAQRTGPLRPPFPVAVAEPGLGIRQRDR